MASYSIRPLACLMVAIVLMAPSTEAIGCGQVVGLISPCLGYIRSKAPLSPSCCNGIRSLNNVASTTPARQDTCKCLKTIAAGLPGINYGLAGGLPLKCRVNIPYKLSPSTDCSKVK